MALLFLTGAELQSAVAECSSLEGTVAIETGTVRTGGAAYKAVADALSRMRFNHPQVTSDWRYARVYVRFAAFPSVNRTFMQAFQSTISLVGVRITPAGVVQLTSGGVTGTGPTISTGTWYCVEFAYRGTGSAVESVLRVDEVQYQTASTGAAQVPDNIRIGWTTTTGGSTDTIYMDDIALCDATGSVNNTHLGAGEVRLLRPVADNAVGADWLLGNSASPAGAAWDAVNNTPPAGVAEGSGTATSQIRDGVSNTSDPAAKADLDVESYDEAGVTGTVRGVRPCAIVGANSGTSSPTSDLQVVSNPAGSSENQTAPTAAAGTYPTNWLSKRGTVIETPTVVKATRPVMRVRKATATTTRLHVCSVGLMVESQPPLPQTITDAGDIPSGEAFGTAAVNLELTAAGDVPTAEAFGVPAVTVEGGPQILSDAGDIPGEEAFGVPTVTRDSRSKLSMVI